MPLIAEARLMTLFTAAEPLCVRLFTPDRVVVPFIVLVPVPVNMRLAPLTLIAPADTVIPLLENVILAVLALNVQLAVVDQQVAAPLIVIGDAPKVAVLVSAPVETNDPQTQV